MPHAVTQGSANIGGAEIVILSDGGMCPGHNIYREEAKVDELFSCVTLCDPRAVFEALASMQSPGSVAARRGMKVFQV